MAIKKKSKCKLCRCDNYLGEGARLCLVHTFLKGKYFECKYTPKMPKTRVRTVKIL